MVYGSGGSFVQRLLSALLVAFFLLSAPGQASSGTLESTSTLRQCGEFLLRVGRTRVIPLKTPSLVTRHIGKAVFYPLVAMASLAKFGWRAFQDPAVLDDWKTQLWQRVRKDALHAVAYAGLVITAQLTSIPYHQYDASLNVQVSPKDHVVVVNAFDPHKKLYQFADYRFERRYGDFTHAEKITANDWTDMLARLHDNAAKNGKAKLLELHGEAVPGSFAVVADMTDGETLARYMASSHSKDATMGIIQLCRELEEQGVVDRNGTIVIYGCSPGNGEKGQKLMVSIGKLLAPDGGRIYASEVIMTSSLLDQLYLDFGRTPPTAVAYFRDVFDVGLPIVRLTREVREFIRQKDPIEASFTPIREIELPASRVGS